MEILLLKNNVSDINTLEKGIALVKQLTSTIGLNLNFTEVITDKQFTSLPFENKPNNDGYVENGYEVNYQEIFDEAKRLGYVFSDSSVACLIYDWTKISPQPTNPIDNGVNIQIPMQWYGIYPDVFASFLLHELCHFNASRYGIPDIFHIY